MNFRDEGKVLLDLSHYATKKEKENATSVDTSGCATKKDFIDKRNINELVNVLPGLNNLKTMVDDL